MQPVSESETDEDPPQQNQNLNLSPLPDRIGFIGAGQASTCSSMLTKHYADSPLMTYAVSSCVQVTALLKVVSLLCPMTRFALQMGEALIRGFCKSGVSSVEQISASVRSFDRQRALSSLGLRVYGNALEGGAADLAANSEIIFLGVSSRHLLI